MKKRCLILFMTILLGASAVFAGCGPVDREKELEYKEQGIAYMDAGEYDKAAESFQLALDQSMGKVKAEELDICFYKALALSKAGDSQGAIDSYTAIVNFDEKNWEAYYLRGNVYAMTKQIELAQADYSQAIALNGNDAQLYIHIYEYLMDAGETEAAQTYYDQATTMKVTTAEGFYYLGRLYYKAGDLALAESNLLQARDGGYDKAYLLLGEIYAAQGAIDKAQTAFESYMTLYPDNADALNNLGQVAVTVGEYDSALNYLKKAMECADEEQKAGIWKNLVAAYEYAQDYTHACKEAKEYLQVYPDDAEMSKEYSFLMTRVNVLDDLDVSAADHDQVADPDAEDTADSADNTEDTEEESEE